jgi:hypothetical protein
MSNDEVQNIECVSGCDSLVVIIIFPVRFVSCKQLHLTVIFLSTQLYGRFPKLPGEIQIPVHLSLQHRYLFTLATTHHF